MDITSRGSIDHPIGKVWEVLRDFHGLEAWHPGLLSCESEGTGVGSARRVTLKDGRGALESLDVLDEDRHALVYTVSESARPATNGLSASISLSEAGDDSTTVEWIVSPPTSHGLTEDMIEGMRAYYPARIQDLADEVGRRAAPE